MGRRIWGLGLAAACLGLASCGGSGSGGPRDTGSPAGDADLGRAADGQPVGPDARPGDGPAADKPRLDLPRTELSADARPADTADDATRPGDTARETAGDAARDADLPPPCIDLDGDGYGPGCISGPDCDDTNGFLNVDCALCDTEPTAAGCPCAAGTPPSACYSGAPAQLGVGACRAGERACVAGLWQACAGEVLPRAESCNDVDDDCNALTDEGVRSECGDCNEWCQVDGFGPGGDTPFAPTAENSDLVELTADGGLQLTQSAGMGHFIWIANSQDDTVSRLDTHTGQELGRYAVCDDPSRTSVDLIGDVWVGCRGDGKVVKIQENRDACPDRDGDGVVATSRDLDGDGRIAPGTAEMLPQGADECVRFTVVPDGPAGAPRALTVDAENYGWVGFSGTGHYRRLHPDTGEVVQAVDTAGTPYGAVIDRDGIIWVAFRAEGQLGRIDPRTSEVAYLAPPADLCNDLYGITVDRKNRIWLGNGQCQSVLLYESATARWSEIGLAQAGFTRGIAASLSGRVCVAHHTWTCQAGGHISCIDDETLAAQLFPLDGPGRSGPVGVAFDAEENLWAVAQCANAAYRIDPVAGTVHGMFPVGQGPYTYSDMTGYALHAFAAPEGYYEFVVDNLGGKLFDWLALYIQADTPAGTAVSLQLRSAWQPEELPAAPWSPRIGPYPPKTFPLLLDGSGADAESQLAAAYAAGPYLGVRVWLTTSHPLRTPVVHGIEIRFQ